MLDHYQILGVSRDASKDQIKRAFRAMAKKYHPDRNASRSQWATAHMKRVIEANGILSNSDRRAAYDRRHNLLHARVHYKSNLRPKGRPEGDSPRVQAEAILYDLLSGHPAQAVENYERLVRDNGGFDLSRHLELRDWVDCKFLIAEQYETRAAQRASRSSRRADHEKALLLYEELYHSDQARRRASYLGHEVGDRILRLCCREIPRSLSPAAAAHYYIRALALELPRARKAFLHKKIAECHLAVGDMESARRQLAIAFQLKPDLKGAAKICQKTAFAPDRPLV